MNEYAPSDVIQSCPGFSPDWLESGSVFENPDRISSFYIPGLPMNRSRTELTGNPDAIKGRHPRGKLNIGFMDGHTALRSPESFSVGVEYTGPGDVHLPSFWEP